MNAVRIPTPLRAYTHGLKEIQVEAGSVQEALRGLAEAYPSLEPHLFDERGALRSYVSVFLNEEDVRNLEGEFTRLKTGDRLMIIPSIAGGVQTERRNTLRPVDHAALKVNQAMIIGLLVAAFVLPLPWLVLALGLAMAGGAAIGVPAFRPVYGVLRQVRVVNAEFILDNPQPHRFAQGMGSAVLLLASVGFQAGQAFIAWALVWLVVALAALNLFGGFCLGCSVYYWLGRLGLPGAVKDPPPGTRPGARPHARA